MGDASVVWALLLIVLALILFFLEILLPSGMLIALAAAASLVIGVVLLFQHDTTTGLVGTIIALIALPAVLGFGLKILPNTPIFRALTLSDRQEATATTTRDAGRPSAAVAAGDEGRALTDLRPVGTCLFDDQRVECLAARGVIAARAAVRVVSVDGMQTKVEAVEA